MSDPILKIYQAGYEDRQHGRDYDPQSHEIVYETQQLLVSDEWIDVNTQMPQPKQRVLLFDKNGFGALSGRLIGSAWYLEGEKDSNANITHWMYLPSEPK